MNPAPPWALDLAADTARKGDPQLARPYRRVMQERSRHYSQAMCVIAGQLVDRINAVRSENRSYPRRDLDGAAIDATRSKRISASLAVTSESRRRLRTLVKRERGSRGQGSRQPSTNPNGIART